MANYAIVNIDTWLVENSVEWDGATEWRPPEGCIAVETDYAAIGWSYDEKTGQFNAPPPIPPTPEEVLAANTSTLDALKALAVSAMTPLLLSMQLGEATDAEVAAARSWQAFSRALQAVDLTAESPNWPPIPE